MHDRSESLTAEIQFCHGLPLWPALMRALALALVAALATGIANASAQTALPPAMEAASGVDAGAPPISESGGGDLNFFSQDLGTILRLRYNTIGYGQDGAGNFDIGTMQV